MASLRYAAKFDPFLSLDCARVEGVGAQGRDQILPSGNLAFQTHLKKLFAGIHSVNFDAEEKHIVTMNSLEGEVVPLRKKIRISSEVESWLSELAREMKDTLKASVESINAINLGTMNRGP